ncbi:hypothetical protein [Parasphingorhabdus halotolerans]|uniref:Uncharacterized protein n=1 Tax=Parasphingorhabdus halotolerans TaxID=2725558 RepID=A0A6H2DNP3_9SPHN|nr:hypothetical protein [Parasphingorhabdus halotolerans]QJB69974.1 hypothetical protein HF685_12315 [Parasphingorhabdus halotolerans]
MHNIATYLTAIFSALVLSPAGLAQETAPGETDAAAKSPVGSYRLTGVMETASNLLLEKDGTYKWELIVGGLDLYSEGNWTQTGGQVILGPHQFKRDMPVFVLGQSYRWDNEESDAAFDAENIRRINRAKWNCAFLTDGGYFSSSDDTPFPKNLRPEEQFDAGVKIERDRYRAYEKAMTAYFARDRSGTDDDLEIAARTAKLEWEEAVAFLAESGRAAGKTMQYQPPPMPAECLYLSADKTGYSANENGSYANWSEGVGIWVNRREYPDARLNISAEFTFADGSKERANSYELGFALASAAMQRQLQSIKLTLLHDGKEYSSQFDVPADFNARVYEVSVDRRVFIKPPFAELRLNMSGDKLLSADGSRGYYAKTR